MGMRTLNPFAISISKFALLLVFEKYRNRRKIRKIYSPNTCKIWERVSVFI